MLEHPLGVGVVATASCSLGYPAEAVQSCWSAQDEHASFDAVDLGVGEEQVSTVLVGAHCVEDAIVGYVRADAFSDVREIIQGRLGLSPDSQPEVVRNRPGSGECAGLEYAGAGRVDEAGDDATLLQVFVSL